MVIQIHKSFVATGAIAHELVLVFGALLVAIRRWRVVDLLARLGARIPAVQIDRAVTPT